MLFWKLQHLFWTKSGKNLPKYRTKDYLTSTIADGKSPVAPAEAG